MDDHPRRLEPRRHRRGVRIVAQIALVAAVVIAGAVVAACGGVVRAGAPAAAPESPPALTPERPPAGRGGADLLIAQIMVSDGNPAAGGTFVLSVIVGNDGTAAAPATRVRFVRSADEAITTDDSEVGMVELPPIAVAGRAGGSAVVSAPESGGTFHYGACVAAVSGESETGNNCSAAVAVVVAASGEPGQPPGREPLDPASPGPGPPEPAPSGVDLTVAAPMASDANPAAGASFTLSATVVNRGTAFSEFTSLRFFRSTDATISVADTEVGVADVPALAASGSLTRSEVVSAPAAGGTFYYGACVDAARGEVATGNNCSPAVTVTVRAPPPGNPDLRIGSTRIIRSPVYVYHSMWVSTEVRNDGGGFSSGTTLRLYVSTSQAVPASDRTEAVTVAIPALVASAKFHASFRRLSAPGAGATYFYRACVEAVAGESDTTNNCGEVVELKVHEDAPDFWVVTSTTGGAASPGDTFSIKVLVYNVGTIPSETATLRYYRSADDAISPGDTELDTDEVRELGVLDVSVYSLELAAPDTPGTYYYGACVDEAPQEAITTNNCSLATSVTVQS